MNVKFHLEAQLRTAAGKPAMVLEIPAGSTLLNAISQLAAELGNACQSHLLTESCEVRPSLLIVVNGESVYSEEARDLLLRQDSEILLMPPIAGG